MSDYAKTLPLILNDLIEEQATDEPARYRQRLDMLLSRYKQLCIACEETTQYCSIIIPAKMIHENSSELNTSLTNISNVLINFHDVSDVRNTLQDQMQIYHDLQNYSQQVNELVTRGNELMKLPMVPKYVQQDIQNIQRIYNDKIQAAQDLVEKLKVKNLERKHFSFLFFFHTVLFVFLTSVYLNFGNVSMQINVVINNKQKN